MVTGRNEGMFSDMCQLRFKLMNVCPSGFSLLRGSVGSREWVSWIVSNVKRLSTPLPAVHLYHVFFSTPVQNFGTKGVVIGSNTY